MGTTNKLNASGTAPAGRPTHGGSRVSRGSRPRAAGRAICPTRMRARRGSWALRQGSCCLMWGRALTLGTVLPIFASSPCFLRSLSCVSDFPPFRRVMGGFGRRLLRHLLRHYLVPETLEVDIGWRGLTLRNLEVRHPPVQPRPRHALSPRWLAPPHPKACVSCRRPSCAKCGTTSPLATRSLTSIVPQCLLRASLRMADPLTTPRAFDAVGSPHLCSDPRAAWLHAVAPLVRADHFGVARCATGRGPRALAYQWRPRPPPPHCRWWR